MTAPLIGLTTRHTDHPTHGWPMVSSPRSYTEALMRARAIPVLVPLNMEPDFFPDLLSRLDGIIFTGGGDIETSHFDGQPHAKVYGVDVERDAFELNLVEAVIETGMPFLGICRGFQVINVALGGTLYTHILDQHDGALDHSYNPSMPTSYPVHPVELTSSSHLAEIYRTESLTVNSLHHQGAKTVGSGLEIIGHAPDGLVEAIALPGHPFGIGVQWHPEWMPEDKTQQKLFTAFRDAAAAYRHQKGNK